MRPLARLSIALALLTVGIAGAAQNIPSPQPPPAAVSQGVQTLYVQSSTVYLKRELLDAVLQAQPGYAASGLTSAADPASADLVLNVTRPFLTFDWVYRLTLHGSEIASGVVHGWDAQEVAPKIAAEVARQLPIAMRPPESPSGRVQFANSPVTRPTDRPGAPVVTSGRTVYVHSDTVYLKDEQLQSAISAGTGFGAYGFRFSPGRAGADLMVDVKRPFLTFDWNWSVRDARTSALLASGTVTAADGVTAAGPLAQQIVAALAPGAITPVASGQMPTTEFAGGLPTTARSWQVRTVASSGPGGEMTITVTPALAMVSGAGGVFHVPAASIVNVRYSTVLHDPSVDVYREWGNMARGVEEVSQYSPDAGAVAGAFFLGVSPLYLGSGLLAGLERTNEGYVHLAWEEAGTIRVISMATADRQQADEIYSALVVAQQQSRGGNPN